jgi:hypothetical protein
MSIRESIAADIVTTLNSVTSPLTIKFVTREPFDFNKLSAAQFPACLVSTVTEVRDDVTIGGSDITRQATITYQIEGYIKAGTLDTQRNLMAEAIEEALDVDRTRGGNAKDTKVVSIEADDGSIAPYGAVLVTVEVMYTFTRGTT